MRMSPSEMLVGGGGLPVCYLLSVVGPLKMLCMGWKDDLVCELASEISIYITHPPPNFRILDYLVIFFLSTWKGHKSSTADQHLRTEKASFKLFGSLVKL